MDTSGEHWGGIVRFSSHEIVGCLGIGFLISLTANVRAESDEVACEISRNPCLFAGGWGGSIPPPGPKVAEVTAPIVSRLDIDDVFGGHVL